MKKLLLVAISLMLLGLPNAHARNSAATYDNKYYSQQEFVAAYNNSTAPMYRDYVVGLDVNNLQSTSPGVNPNVNLGQYITETTGSTTDNLYVFGVVDDTVIPAGQLGRVAIRGPHKVVFGNLAGTGHAAPTLGAILSQCSGNQAQVSVTGIIANGGVACTYTTATGTAGGMLGYVINATATTDTGDVNTATNAQNQGTSTNSEYWVWISPQILR